MLLDEKVGRNFCSYKCSQRDSIVDIFYKLCSGCDDFCEENAFGLVKLFDVVNGPCISFS